VIELRVNELYKDRPCPLNPWWPTIAPTFAAFIEVHFKTLSSYPTIFLESCWDRYGRGLVERLKASHYRICYGCSYYVKLWQPEKNEKSGRKYQVSVMSSETLKLGFLLTWSYLQIPTSVVVRSKAGSATALLLGLRVQIPLAPWMSVCCEFCVLSSWGPCVGLIIRPEESYRVWCVWV
jgi:hypothetical protein